MLLLCAGAQGDKKKSKKDSKKGGDKKKKKGKSKKKKVSSAWPAWRLRSVISGQYAKNMFVSYWNVPLKT